MYATGVAYLFLYSAVPIGEFGSCRVRAQETVYSSILLESKPQTGPLAVHPFLQGWPLQKRMNRKWCHDQHTHITPLRV